MTSELRPRTAVIMQPTYLPWLGYFDLIDQADVFVFLDDAQLSRKSWHQRNRIRTPRGLEWLTVPVRTAGRFPLLIKDAEIARDSGFPRDHIRAIEFNYRTAPFFDAWFPSIRALLDEPETRLCHLNIRIITTLARAMGIATPFEVASVLGGRGKRSDLMIDLCVRVGASRCLSPIGSADYLATEYDPVRAPGLELVFHNYEHPVYRQMFEPFMPFASVIDLLLNEGDRSLATMRSGRRHPLAAQQVFISRSVTAETDGS